MVLLQWITEYDLVHLVLPDCQTFRSRTWRFNTSQYQNMPLDTILSQCPSPPMFKSHCLKTYFTIIILLLVFQVAVSLPMLCMYFSFTSSLIHFQPIKPRFLCSRNTTLQSVLEKSHYSSSLHTVMNCPLHPPRYRCTKIINIFWALNAVFSNIYDLLWNIFACHFLLKVSVSNFYYIKWKCHQSTKGILKVFKFANLCQNSTLLIQ